MITVERPVHRDIDGAVDRGCSGTRSAPPVSFRNYRDKNEWIPRTLNPVFVRLAVTCSSAIKSYSEMFRPVTEFETKFQIDTIEDR